jgi:hypothetical protein
VASPRDPSTCTAWAQALTGFHEAKPVEDPVNGASSAGEEEFYVAKYDAGDGAIVTLEDGVRQVVCEAWIDSIRPQALVFPAVGSVAGSAEDPGLPSSVIQISDCRPEAGYRPADRLLAGLCPSALPAEQSTEELLPAQRPAADGCAESR